MKMRTGGAPGAAGESDDVSRLHRLACFCQQLGAVAVQRGESVAVVDHRIDFDVFVSNEISGHFLFPSKRLQQLWMDNQDIPAALLILPHINDYHFQQVCCLNRF